MKNLYLDKAVYLYMRKCVEKNLSKYYIKSDELSNFITHLNINIKKSGFNYSFLISNEDYLNLKYEPAFWGKINVNENEITCKDGFSFYNICNNKLIDIGFYDSETGRGLELFTCICNAAENYFNEKLISKRNININPTL